MVRTSLVGVGLGALLAAPLVAVAIGGIALGDVVPAVAVGFLSALDAVGWVLLPQIVLAIAVLGLALEQIACRVSGLPARPAPGWLDPAVESALLLGLLGTISGMVSGFIGLSPDEIQPGPLVHALGTALRSSLLGFGIALVGVWTKTRPESARPVVVEVEPA